MSYFSKESEESRYPPRPTRSSRQGDFRIVKNGHGRFMVEQKGILEWQGVSSKLDTLELAKKELKSARLKVENLKKDKFSEVVFVEKDSE